MNEATKVVLVQQMESAVRDYLAGTEEGALLRAYEIGRHAIEEGVGAVDLVQAHHDAMTRVLLGASGPREIRMVLQAGEAALVEMLGPIEMAYRGYRETNTALRHLNESLEQQVAERTRSLRETEARFRQLVENALDIITFLDREGRIRYGSPSVRRVLGYEPEELVGSPVVDLVHPEDRPRITALLEEASSGETLPPSEELAFRARHRDGSWRELEAVANNLLDDPHIGRIIAIARDVTDRSRAERDLQRSVRMLERLNLERQRLLQRAVNAQEEERRRIAADIHDDPIQLMTAVLMRLQTLRPHVRGEERIEALARLEENVRQAIGRLRNLMFELRPRALDREGLAAALRIRLERFHGDTGIETVMEDRLEAEPPGEIAAVAYRIAQEALVNVRKHADASRVTVTLEERDGGVYARVSDDGVGFDADRAPGQAPDHSGILDMHERAEMAGGWCRVKSRPGEGTTVELWIPRHAEEAAG